MNVAINSIIKYVLNAICKILSTDWGSVIGRVSSYIDVDSDHEPFRTQSEMILIQELSFVSHVGIPTALIKLKKSNNVNLARIIYDRCQENTLYQTNVSYICHFCKN